MVASAATLLPLLNHLHGTSTAHPGLGEAARAFEPVIGSWDLDCVFTNAEGRQTAIAGEWHFGWILGGRMLQDVLYFYPRGQRPASAADLRGGTTLRLFDPKAGQWLVTWFAAMRGEAIHLHGGAEGRRIVLHGKDVDGSLLRWTFNDITEQRFRWLGETSSDQGLSWRIEQEMQLRRMSTKGVT
jgi:hypothetical protein